MRNMADFSAIFRRFSYAGRNAAVRPRTSHYYAAASTQKAGACEHPKFGPEERLARPSRTLRVPSTYQSEAAVQMYDLPRR